MSIASSSLAAKHVTMDKQALIKSRLDEVMSEVREDLQAAHSQIATRQKLITDSDEWKKIFELYIRSELFLDMDNQPDRRKGKLA